MTRNVDTEPGNPRALSNREDLKARNKKHGDN